MAKFKLFVMRSLTLIIAFAASGLVSAQQPDTLQNQPNLLLPKFMKGIVKLKDGKKNTAILNYDLVNQQMVFLQRKLTLVLDNPLLVDTIFLANRIFVPFDKGFFEVLFVSPNYVLFKQNKSYAESKGTPIGYGAMSQTTPMSYVRQIYGANGAIDLKVPNDVKIVDDSDYWIRRDGKMDRFSSRSQLVRLFPQKSKELDSFIRKNRVDFTKSDQVRNVIAYLDGLPK
ncbi:MAG: hypothetical protein U0X39_03305 [Bacteroidales bacterium]